MMVPLFSSTLNWGIGRPSDDVRRSCVQMQSDVARGLSDMKWTDIACTIGNWFVCQKFQTCSCENFQQALLATRRDLQHFVEIFTRQMADVKNQLDELRNNQPDFPDEQLAEMRHQIRELQDNELIRDKQIANMSNQLRDLRNNQSDWHNITSQLKYLQNNPVPIGFIYVQLRNQSEPGALWVNTTWQEITSQYAGLFFRAVGEGSAAFGVTQLENSPRLTDVGTARLPGFVNQIPIQPTGSWSVSLPVGEPNPSASVHFGLSFAVRSGEVRPRNTAMRIWIRTG
ncbi:uncharacterized protein LOC119074162 [Bradysia coprophila]|uniref:uncharacterized protein LOC119074162 n=1 Tax=Bradysia coprophila TaxID=38358 RepID=UPI00187D6FEF|nr:uncharacterized protein LOC119074162 [Bradysia coprophila]XP_037036062.1 uncharacterized protein LOC119074162 [Bradysia coprophila]